MPAKTAAAVLALRLGLQQTRGGRLDSPSTASFGPRHLEGKEASWVAPCERSWGADSQTSFLYVVCEAGGRGEACRLTGHSVWSVPCAPAPHPVKRLRVCSIGGALALFLLLSSLVIFGTAPPARLLAPATPHPSVSLLLIIHATTDSSAHLFVAASLCSPRALVSRVLTCLVS